MLAAGTWYQFSFYVLQSKIKDTELKINLPTQTEPCLACTSLRHGKSFVGRKSKDDMYTTLQQLAGVNENKHVGS